MHIHLPLVFVVIFYSAIVLYWIIYKILLRKKLSPLLVSLIANSNYSFIKFISWAIIIAYPFMLFSMFYFLDYIAVPIVYGLVFTTCFSCSYPIQAAITQSLL